jgi:probable F420-dependent oxidoreductase
VARPTLTVSINAVVPHLARDHTEIAGLAADVEAWGADQVVLGEHLLMFPAESYPGGSGVDLMIAWPDPFGVLAAVAARTSRLLLTTGGVLGGARAAVVTAKLAATVDALSGGRFRLGIVAGWFEAEFTAVGIPFEERFARVDEMIAVCRALWGSQPASFDGRWTSFENMLFDPLPVARPHLPIWFGGRASEATMKRVSGCDGWIVSEAADVAEICDGVVRIRGACMERGRPSEEVGIRATLPRELHSGVRTSELPVDVVCDEAWKALMERVNIGVTDICVPVHSYVTTREAAGAVITELVSRADDEFGPAALTEADMRCERGAHG